MLLPASKVLLKSFILLLICFSLVLFVPKAVSAHSQTAIIKMTENGFEPRVVTIHENSTPLFVNEDKVDHWPASNPHPTHDLYPEFDPQKPIAPGSSWPFKLKRAGEWKYHDHLNPHIRGTLIVQSEKENTETKDENIFVKIFTGIKDWFTNFMDKFSASLMKNKQSFSTNKKEDPLLVWNNLKEKYKGQSGSTGNVHDQAHLIGGLIYDSEGLSGLSKCSPEFAFGCFHGFLDKAFQKNLDKLELAEKSCRNLGEGGPSASCIHGIGHGVASFYQTADLKASLSSCKRLSAQSLQYCFDGVFMEFERSAPQTFYSKENPYYPCDQVERELGPDASFACGRNQPTVLMDRFKYSLEDVIKVCLSSSSDQFKAACFDSIGFITTKSTSNPQQIMAACTKIGVSEYILRCAKAAAGELIFQEIPGWQQSSPAICSLLPPNFQIDCQNYIDQLIKQYGRQVSSKFSEIKSGEDENEYIRDQLRICYQVSGKDNCYKSVAGLFFNQFGLKKTLNLLQENENYPEVYVRCHEVTHFLSRSEYDRLGSIAGVYASCDSTCHGGCYHGTLEAYLKARNLDEDDLKREFIKVCGQKEDHLSPLVFNECLHGLGHAAMFILVMDLPKSLSLCDQFQNQDQKDRCFSGVFMENSSSSTSEDHTSRYIKEDDPFYPCNSLDEKYLTVCWRYQSSYFSIISHQDWAKVSSLCLDVPEKYQDECFRTIGTNQVGFTKSLQTMRDDCYLMPNSHFKDVCVAGVVASLSYRFVGDATKMVEFCSLVDPEYKEGCFKQMGQGFLDWNTNLDLVKRNCQAIPDSKGASWCMSVI